MGAGLRVSPTRKGRGYLWGVRDTTARWAVTGGLPLLDQAGRDTRQPTRREQRSRRTRDVLLQDLPDLAVILDSFEQPVQRPPTRPEAAGYYAGTKKRHTLKSHVTGEEHSGRFRDVSARVPRPTADLTLRKASGVLERLPPQMGALGDRADHPFRIPGMAALHPTGWGASPRRKPHGQPRPPADTRYNTAFSRRRIVVAHRSGRLRCYPAVRLPDRQHRAEHAPRVRAVAGLGNWQIAKPHRAA